MRPIFYVYLQGKLKERANGRCLPLKTAQMFLSYYSIPKLLRNKVLNEMVELGMLEISEANRIRIINCTVSDDINGFSRMTRRRLLLKAAE